MTGLLIAAGGGGDPIGAALVHPDRAGDGTVVLTHAWERPTVDPRPGPLAAHDLTGLDRGTLPAPLITAATATVPPRVSTLPRLAAQLPLRLGMLDAHTGVEGLAEQIARTAQALGTDRLGIVDVGGDILARGDEPTLASPLLDALVLAACRLTGLHTTVHLAGPGLDGELPEATLLPRLPGEGTPLAAGLPDWASAVLHWHPSEASTLLAAAATGLRGPCLTRSGIIPLTDRSARVWTLRIEQALDRNPLAQGLLETRAGTLAEAEEVSQKLYGFNEVERERKRAARPHTARDRLDEAAFHREFDTWLHLQHTAHPEARHATVRCVVESLNYAWHLTGRIRTLLDRRSPAAAAFPLVPLT